MAPAEATAPAVRVVVVYCPAPRQADAVTLDLPAGSTAADAFAASGLAERHPACTALPLGIGGRVRDAATPLRDGDRVEVLRPLVVDPKEARRLRHGGQKTRVGKR